MRICRLSTGWQLRHEELYIDGSRHAMVVERTDGWLDVPRLPCDVHVPLMEAGIIADPVVADNCLRCEWIESKSWWFKKTFHAGRELLDARNSELVIEGLDAKADLFLNGEQLGHHPSAMYPFRKDVRDLLREGANVLVIRVTSGLEYYSELDVAKIKDYVSCEYKRGRGPRGDNRRVFVRKPQYVYGWDWTPRIATCGIMGEARIEAYDDIAIRDARFTTERLSENHADICIEVEIECLDPIATSDVTMGLKLGFNGVVVASVEKEVFARSGINFVTFDLAVASPHLWWPNGMGPQNLYSVKIGATTAAGASEERELTCGIRTIALDTTKIDSGSRMFAFEINGIRTFCKGANWETPDSLYGRVTDAKYEHLIREAREAHFNMFRVNACNAYERDYFYDCCDRHGILLWQESIGFSCAAYPDELDWFRREVEHEVEYQTRRLRNHPCLALWCGNNECLAHLAGYRPGGYWAGDRKPASPGGTVLYNDIMPRIIRRNCPEIPYWNSSPYGGATDLESDDYGDRHHWIFMSENMGERITPEEYDKIACKFVSEFGCVGPTRESSLHKYYGSTDVDRSNTIWQMHTNTWEKHTVEAALHKHYADPQSLSLQDYLLYAGLFQGVTLGYALESMRYAHNNYGALIWSFNDAWGEVGWSIIDYYGVRKIAYPFVKRALEPAKLILREKDDAIVVVCLNDSRETLAFDLEYGYMSLTGDKKDVDRAAITVKPSTKAMVVGRMKKGPHDRKTGLYYAVADNGCGIRPAALREVEFRNLRVPPAAIRLTDRQADGATVRFTVSSATYAHAVHFGLPDDIAVSDEYFDLLPGEARHITVSAGDIPLRDGDIVPRAVLVPQQDPRDL